MTGLKRYIGFAVLAIGVITIILGGYFVSQGIAARDEIKASLAEEQVTTTIDEVKVPVADQATLMIQADVIKGHTLGKYGPWQSMERDDPNRATMLDGLTLRNSLYLARMGLDVSELVIGLGAIFLTLGTGLAIAGAVIVQIERAMMEKKPVEDIREGVPHPTPA